MTVESPSLIKHAVEHHSAASKKGLLERLFTYWFDGFVYNQIWEDPRVDMEALRLDSNSRIMTIASGGCNILNYLTAGPAAIHAVDLNQYHVHFTTLKFTALRCLPNHEAFFDFYGYANKRENVANYYKYIRENLPEATREYWETGGIGSAPRIHYFENNIYNYGAMGKFIGFVHRLCIWFAEHPREMLKVTDLDKRTALFNEKFSPFFDRWLVKTLGRMPFMFYSLGIPPQQFECMKRECNGQLNELCRDRIHRMALQFPIDDNYFAWQAFDRRYDTENRVAIPDYLKEENYAAVKTGLDKVTLDLISTTNFLKKQPDDSMNRFILLDSMDWMDAADITELWSEIARVGQPGSRVIFRTAAWDSPIEPSLPADLMARFHYYEEDSKRLFQQDRSAIYGGFHIYELKG
ncbi:MAG: DUF3419 family protein [bacterium]|nr:DUF3419 family protein [bacterium]